MPIHDWTRVTAGDFHDFHQDWTTELRRRLNAGLPPPGCRALTGQRVEEWEPDITSFHGTAILNEGPPRVGSRPESAAGAYARRANRIVVRHPKGTWR